MKFAIPTENEKLCAHFGSCKLFTFIEVEDSSKEIISEETKAPNGKCHEYMVPWVLENKADVVIAGGMGGPAQQMVRDAGIKVVAGACPATPKELVKDYLAGSLKTTSNTCNCDCSHH